MPSDPSALIVGAGFGGLAAAIELIRHGFDDVTILEKADDVGGVWLANTYPGAACDAPSDLYSFSFAQNKKWPKRFAEQPDILAYLREVADRYGIRERIRFGVEVTEAEFDSEQGQWRVRTNHGDELTADVFVPAVGQLSRPTVPEFAGRGEFAGAQFHSAQWNHDVELKGKRVAVIGTGASAIQIVPAIAPHVAHLTVFQRSQPWILPKFESWYLPASSGPLRRVPFVQTIERRGWWTYFEFVSKALDGNAPIREALTAVANRHRTTQISDRRLQAALKPVDAPGCKRGLMSNDFYPALARKNAQLETGRIERITTDGVITEDGTHHPVDVIVYCTGFTATDFLAPLRIRGLDGQDLNDHWAAGARAFLGISVPGFPNMFLMYGPNTNLGAGSIVYMHEQQARHIRQAVQHLRRKKAAYVTVKPDVADQFDEEIQQRLSRTVWTLCSSWYRDASGRITTNWPGRMAEYGRRTRFDPSCYETVSVAK